MSIRKYTVKTTTISTSANAPKSAVPALTDIVEQRPARTIEGVGDPLLQMETIV